jgi:hypothetical protein
MRHVLQLLGDRPIQHWMAMAMDVGPDGRVGIEVPSAVTVFQPCSLAGDQHQWLVLGRNPISHRRERMPDVGLVELDEGFGGVSHGVEVERSGGVSTQALKHSSTQALKHSIAPSLHQRRCYFSH